MDSTSPLNGRTRQPERPDADQWLKDREEVWEGLQASLRFILAIVARLQPVAA